MLVGHLPRSLKTLLPPWVSLQWWEGGGKQVPMDCWGCPPQHFDVRFVNVDGEKGAMVHENRMALMTLPALDHCCDSLEPCALLPGWL